MSYLKTKIILLIFISIISLNGKSQSTCSWNPDKKELIFSLSEISGILNCDAKNNKGVSHVFKNVLYKPTNMLLSPDSARMKGVGMFNFYRVLIQGGYLTELRADEPLLEPKDDGIILTWMPTIRRQAKVKVKFTFRQPNIIDMDMWLETLSSYPAFEILLSAYLADGFESGVYVASQEFGPMEPQQIRIIDQPMIHGVWPFFPRNEAGANLLTDGRHQKGRWYWRMAVGRKYGLPLAFFSKDNVDVILMGRPDDVYAVGATYKGDKTDNVADHRAMYLSLLGDDFKAGESRYTQMRMIIGNYQSNPEKHKLLYQSFLKEQESKPRTFYISPEPRND